MPLIIDGISSRFILEHRLVPFEQKNNILKVAAPDSVSSMAMDALRVATSSQVFVYTADDKLLDDYIARFYGQESQNINKIIEDIGDKGIEYLTGEEEDIGHLRDLASEAPIIKLVNLLISRAVEGRASDIHIEPYQDELKIRYRIDGVLHDAESTPKRLQAAIVSRVKIMAKLNIAERRLPQDGRIRLRLGEQEIDLRVSTIPVLHGESVVMRILRKEGITIDLDLLGFPADVLREFKPLTKSRPPPGGPHRRGDSRGRSKAPGPKSGRGWAMASALETSNEPGDPGAAEAAYDGFVREHLRRNYAANFIHGMLGMTGFRLFNAPTFIPAYLHALSGSDAMVGLGLGLQQFGSVVSPVVGAAHVEHRKKLMPAAVFLGLGMRLPMLLMAVAGWTLSGAPLLWSLLLLLFLFGLFGGMQRVVSNS